MKHDEELCELSNKIGNRGEPDSLPGWPEDLESMANDPEYVPQEYMKRDVRGVCEDTELQNRFALIADSVKKDSGLGDVISGLRVAPAGVMCMIHPRTLLNLQSIFIRIYLMTILTHPLPPS